MDYPLPGKITVDERMDRKATLLVFMIVGIIAVGVWLLLPSLSRDQKIDLQFAWTAVYSDSRIVSRFGKVVDAHIKQERTSRRRSMGSRDAHHRTEINGIVHGKIEFVVVGTEEVGTAVLHYVCDQSGKHNVERIDLNPLPQVRRPNKAPEPTP